MTEMTTSTTPTTAAWRLPLPREQGLSWPSDALDSNAAVLVAAAPGDLELVEKACGKAAPRTPTYRFHRYLAEAPPGANYVVVVRDPNQAEDKEDAKRRLVEAWAVRHHPDALVVVAGAQTLSDLEALVAIHLGGDEARDGQTPAKSQLLQAPASTESSGFPAASPPQALFAEVDEAGFAEVAATFAEANCWKIEHRRPWKLPIARIDPPFMASTMSIESCERARCFVPRPSDVIIATAPKSGTTMLQWICHLLRTDGGRQPGALDFQDMYQASPWIELSWDMGLDPYEAPHTPRNYKSHVRLGSVQPGCKYITTVRDPMRIVISYYNFLGDKGVPEVCAMSISEFLRWPEIADGQMFGASIWDYYVEYYHCRDDPSVLCLVFEDFLSDPETQIRAIADFMEIENPSEDLIDRVVALSTKNAMKEHASKFDESWASKEISRLGRARQAVHFEESSRVVTKSHDDKFTDEDLAFFREKWEAIIAKPLGFKTYEDLAQEIRKSVHARLDKTPTTSSSSSMA